MPIILSIFFSKNDQVLELTHLINVIFFIIVNSKDNIDDSFCVTSTFNVNDKISHIIDKINDHEKWIIAGVGFKYKEINFLFDLSLQNYLKETINRATFFYRIFDERLWLKQINLKNCFSNKGSWLFERVATELKALDYRFSIQTRWENLYLQIKDMDFDVHVILAGSKLFSLQLYINYLGAHWIIYPEYNSDITGIKIYEKINISYFFIKLVVFLICFFCYFSV